jgi:hypothetical protein
VEHNAGRFRLDESKSIKFTSRELGLIAKGLPKNTVERRLALLPDIIRDWGRTDLPRHFWVKPEPVEVRNERYRRLKRFETAVNEHADAFAALDKKDRNRIIMKLACPPNQYPRGLTVTNLVGAEHDLDKTYSLLPRFSAAAQAASEPYVPKQGPAPDNVGYLVLLDLAEIFQWVTNIEATRRVDRKSRDDSGPFHHFTAAVWPLVFGSDDGLSNSLKEWAAARKKYSERSQVLLNLDIRHPEWGIFRL